MPVMNGHDCTRLFRAWEAAQQRDAAGAPPLRVPALGGAAPPTMGAAAPMRLPIVGFTASALEETYAASLAAGMDGVSSKPLRQETTAGLRARALEFARQRQQ